MAYRSYAVTVRPLAGISEETITGFSKWFNKQQYVVAVLEKEGSERHLHFQLWWDEAKTRGDVSKQVQRICERTIPDFDRAQLKVLRGGVKIAYSDWYLDYLTDNEDKPRVLGHNLLMNVPPAQTMEFYPTEEEQEAIREKSGCLDNQMFDLEKGCITFCEERELELSELRSICIYLAHAQNVARIIKPIRREADRRALAKTLHSYINKVEKWEDWMSMTPKEKEHAETLHKARKIMIEHHQLNNPDLC